MTLIPKILNKNCLTTCDTSTVESGLCDCINRGRGRTRKTNSTNLKKNTMNEKEQLYKRLKEINESERLEQLEKHKALLESLPNKCFKIKNNYGNDGEEWDMYVKVLSIDLEDIDFSNDLPNGHFNCLTFQEDCRGEITIHPKEYHFLNMLADKEITEKEFQEAWNDLTKKIMAI